MATILRLKWDLFLCSSKIKKIKNRTERIHSELALHKLLSLVLDVCNFSLGSLRNVPLSFSWYSLFKQFAALYNSTEP